MLPFLLAGGLVAGLGKLLYDALSDDNSSSSSNDSVDAQVKAAQAQRNKEIRRKASRQLLVDTETAVALLLDKHAGLVTGQAKSAPVEPVEDLVHVVNPATSWSFPTGRSGQSREDEANSAGDATLCIKTLRELGDDPNRKKGFDALKPLTAELAYTHDYLEERKTIAQMRKQRDALRTLAENL
jgi:hypothetical protein